MGVVVLTGGLGNQLFQICFALYLQQNSTDEIAVDYESKSHRLKHGLGQLTEILELVDLNSFENRDTYSYKSKLAAAFFLRTHAHRLKLNNPERKEYSTSKLKNRVHVGFWQNDPRLFEQYTSLAKLLGESIPVQKNGLNCVHMRFGDYKSETNILRYHQLDKSYYFDALSRVNAETENPVFNIVTDQPELATRMLSDEIFSQFNIEFGNRTAWDDFVILSGSRSIIASNSTYCWWAAVIAQQSEYLEQLVTPRDWYQPGFRHLSAPDYMFLNRQSSKLSFSAI